MIMVLATRKKLMALVKMTIKKVLLEAM